MNQKLRTLLFEELKQQTAGGFLPAVKQVANVASLPGLVGLSIGLPDIHSGYDTSIIEYNSNSNSNRNRNRNIMNYID